MFNVNVASYLLVGEAGRDKVGMLQIQNVTDFSFFPQQYDWSNDNNNDSELV
jgi:hypothetical protein